MHVEVLVRFGKPLLKLRVSTMKYIGVAMALLIVIIFLYSLYLLIFAVQIKINIGDYVSLINNDGWILPLGTVIPAIFGFAIGGLGLFLLVKVFTHADKKMVLNHFIFLYVLVCCVVFLLDFIVSVFMLVHSYSPHEALHDGIMEAMNKYAYDSDLKRHMDILQVEFDCCGSQKYNEWFDIVWYDANLINNETEMPGGQTPFSCCSMFSIFPCVHYGIEAYGSAYIYSAEVNISISKHGCHEMILERKRATCWGMFGLINLLGLMMLILASGMRLIQTAHHERGRFIEGGHIYTAWILGCYRGKKRTVQAPPVPPASPEIMDSSES